jgi:hypothetical protein
MAKQTDDLLTYLFDGGSSLLVQPMAGWLASSRRFANFATTYRDKIRKKLHTTQDQKSALDLQLELETAYLLLQDRSLSLAYEPEQSKGIRSPDFCVTFATNLTFMVEVTRVQTDKNSAGETTSSGARLADAVIDKLGQLLPSRVNILLAAIEAPHLTPGDLRNAMFSMQNKMTSTFLQRHGFLHRADFFRYYQRLSEVLVRVPHSEAARSMVTWINPQAKHSLPSRARTVLHRSLSG